MKEYMRQKRSISKDASKDYVENTNNKLLLYIKNNHPDVLSATQAGISLKFKLDEFKQFCEWIEFLDIKSRKFKVELTIDDNISITNIQNLQEI